MTASSTGSGDDAKRDGAPGDDAKRDGAPGDDAKREDASGAGGTAQPGGEPSAVPRDPYTAPPPEWPPRQQAPYGQGPGGYGDLQTPVGGWRPGLRNESGTAEIYPVILPDP